MLLQVGVGDDVQVVALPLGPRDERELPVGPARRAGPRREVVHGEVADVGRHLAIGRMHHGDPAPGTRRLGQVTGAHRALQADRGAAVVEVAPTEVVVGVPRVRRQRQQDPGGGGTGRRPHHEEGVAASGSAADVDLEGHLVVARRPRRIDLDGARRRPPAPLGRGAGGGRMIADLDAWVGEDHGPDRADAGHLDGGRPPTGRRQVQPDALAGAGGLRPAVPDNRLVGHRATLMVTPAWRRPGGLRCAGERNPRSGGHRPTRLPAGRRARQSDGKPELNLAGRDRPLGLAPASVRDYRELARRRLPRQLFDYIDGGAYEEATMRPTSATSGGSALRQRVLRDVSGARAGARRCLGEQLSLPVVLAPVGLGRHVRPAGRGAGGPRRRPHGRARSASRPCRSAGSRRSPPPPTAPSWFQLYVMRDRAYAEDLMARAQAVGVPVLVLTVDLAVVGARYRDVRNGVAGSLPPLQEARRAHRPRPPSAAGSATSPSGASRSPSATSRRRCRGRRTPEPSGSGSTASSIPASPGTTSPGCASTGTAGSW